MLDTAGHGRHFPFWYALLNILWGEVRDMEEECGGGGLGLKVKYKIGISV
jgi:hypothetical protein